MAKHPINNRDLYIEIYVSKGMGKLTPSAKDMLYLLAQRAIRKMPYSNIDDRNDCIQTGLYNMFLNWHKFNPDKSTNAFAYFTEVFKRGIAQGFNELYKKKGDPNNDVKIFHINSINDGDGMFNL